MTRESRNLVNYIFQTILLCFSCAVFILGLDTMELTLLLCGLVLLYVSTMLQWTSVYKNANIPDQYSILGRNKDEVD